MSEHKNPAYPKKLFKIILKGANHVKGKFKNKDKSLTKSHFFPFYGSHVDGMKVYVVFVSCFCNLACYCIRLLLSQPRHDDF